MELPGTGRSPLRAAAASIQTMISAVADVAAALDEAPILFGHSMNGTLALAASRSLACAGVIAVTPPPRLPPDPTQSTAYWEAHADEVRRRRGRELVAAYGATTDAAERSSLQEKFDRLRRWHDLDFDSTDLDRLAETDLDWVGCVLGSGRSVDWPGTMKDVACPVLLALGASDFVAPPTAWTEDLKPPKATVYMFSRSGHTPYFEEPDDFLRATEAWLAAIGG